MTIREKLKEKLIEKVEKEYGKQREDEVKNATAWHSRAYHRHFEGTSEKYVVDPRTGKRKIERVYTGVYYRAELTRNQLIAGKLWVLLAFLGTLALFFSASLTDWSGFYNRLVTLPHALCFAANAYLLIVLCSYLPAGEKLTIPQYRSGVVGLRRAASLAAAAHLMAALAAGIYMYGTKDFGGISATLRFLGCSLLMGSVWFFQRRISYEVLENPAVGLHDGTQIQ